MNTDFDIIVLGGGAAGFFTAINSKEKHPELKVAILEKSNEVLQKVRISGGGRCNFTNAEIDKSVFLKNYPRGQRELRNIFYQFDNQSVINWFLAHAVSSKTEKDGRVFPESNTSQTIVDCFLHLTQKLEISVFRQQNVENFYQDTNKIWNVKTSSTVYTTKKLVIATGSATKIWHILQEIGHSIVPPVPSLFTFNILDEKVHQLMGVSSVVQIHLPEFKLSSEGNLLFTHWGFSGPAILKLSSFGARYMAEKNYQFDIRVNWVPQLNEEQLRVELTKTKQAQAKKNILAYTPFGFTRRLWDFLVQQTDIPLQLNWADVSKKQLQQLQNILQNNRFSVSGKSTFKDEFVTSGGVSLAEIDFKTMQSKLLFNLYFAGEVIDIDAVTGGFNFQNAWTTAWTVSENI